MDSLDQVRTVRLDKPFGIEPYTTEWNYWADPVPFINSKFGNRPVLTPMGGLYWHVWDEKILEKTVRENTVLYLNEASHDTHFDQLFKACSRIGEPRLIVTCPRIRSSIKTPDNVRVIHTDALAYQFSKLVKDVKPRLMFHRKVDDLEHPFLIMASNKTNTRDGPRILMMLNALGVLDDTLYTCPDMKSSDQLYIEDTLGINNSLKDLNFRSIENKPYDNRNHRDNIKQIIKALDKCHFHVARNSNIIWDHHQHWAVDQVHLQGYASATPVLSIWDDEQAQQMTDWGFRINNIPCRRKNETEQEAITRWCQKILFYTQMTKNKEWAQSWQDTQGEDAVHNFEQLNGLHKKIYSNIERQIDELPVEFRNL